MRQVQEHRDALDARAPGLNVARVSRSPSKGLSLYLGVKVASFVGAGLVPARGVELPVRPDRVLNLSKEPDLTPS